MEHRHEHHPQTSNKYTHDEFQDKDEEQQPEQTDMRNQRRSQLQPTASYPPSRPASTWPQGNAPPQPVPQQFPPQPVYYPTAHPVQATQQFPQQPVYYPAAHPVQAPQPVYYPAAHPVQAPPWNYPPQATTHAYSRAPAPGVNYQNGTPAMYQNGGYAPAPAPAPVQGYPQQSAYPYQPNQGTVGWSTGLFDCMDDPTNALITACCPCLTYGQVAEIVDNGNTSCATSGILYAVIAAWLLVPCLISCTVRTKMRNQYNLAEVPAADWITHCFCEWCALCQEYRELKNRGLDPAIGWHGNIRRNQQQPQVAMMPPVYQTMQGPHAMM